MRILHVTDSYLPTIGGLERAVHTLVRAQHANGDTVAVLTAQHPDAPEETIEDGVLVLRKPMLVQSIPGAITDPRRPFNPTVSDPRFARAVARAIAQFRPDLIHTHAWSQFSVLAAARRAGIPIVATAHDYGHVCAVKTSMLADGTVCPRPSTGACTRHALAHYGPKGIPIALGLRTSLRRSRDVTWTAISTAVQQQAQGSAYFIPGMQVVPSYVPDSVLTESTLPRPDWAPAGDYLLFVGALGPFKGIGVLIDAHQQLRAEGLHIPLLVIGTPRPDTPNTDLPGITVRTNVPHDHVMAAWRDATIGAAPSVMAEAFGQVIIEAMAAGTPIISTNHGGPADIITDHVNGILVPPGNPAALAAAIKELWNDPPLRTRLAAAGRQRAADFTISRTLPEVYRVYREATAQQTRPQP